MGFLTKLFGKQKLFSSFSDAEKRTLQDINKMGLHSEKMRRSGKATVIDTGGKHESLLKRLTDEEFAKLSTIRELTDKADSKSGSEAIRLYQEVSKLAPWDEICLMSIGVEYAQAGKYPEAIAWLEKAAKLNPDNKRVRSNLQAVKAAAGRA